MTPKEIEDAYWELIYAVASVTPGETRHQTALRYITERENRIGGPAQEAPAQRDVIP